MSRILPYHVSTGLQHDVSHRRAPQQHFTSSETLSVFETGKTCTNLGASGEVILTLPSSAPKGVRYTFAVQAAQTFKVNPGSGGGFYFGGSKRADDTDLSSATIGDCVTVESDGNGDWITVDVHGTWGQSGSTYVPYIPLAAQQALSGAGAINITSYYTAWTTTGADAATLADGAIIGQLKKIQMVVDADDGTLTPTNLAGGTTITFADVGDYAVLSWNGTEWVAIELGNAVDGATGPTLA